MEQGSKRPDAPKLAHATVRAAVLEASRLVPELALLAGGKSFGGRMTSQAQAASPFPGVRGLVFLGFPLHPRMEWRCQRNSYESGRDTRPKQSHHGNFHAECATRSLAMGCACERR